MREISVLRLQDPQRLELLYKLQAEIMDFTPWVLALNDKDIHGLSHKVDWKPFPNENRLMYGLLGCFGEAFSRAVEKVY
jgi:hypothetical protein